jgi:hypothetical protein
MIQVHKLVCENSWNIAGQFTEVHDSDNVPVPVAVRSKP